jgi:hypothetical protein
MPSSSFLLLWVARPHSKTRNAFRRRGRLTVASAPALDKIDAGYNLVRFNSTVGNPTPFGGTPRPEVDNAWAAVDQGKYTRN